MSTLLLITIGPVQELIAAARTTRDLWFGSTLLSRVSRHLARTLHEAGAELIFPESIADERAAVPNRIFAEATRGDVAALVESARQAATAELHRYRQQVRANFSGSANAVNWELVERQIDTYLEFYAAWAPYDRQQPGSYQAQRAQVERLLAGRKALREFSAPAGEMGRIKSALDPSRESVITSKITPTDRRQLGLKAHEQLDGLSLIRRNAEPESFPSISRVAIDPFIRRLGTGELASLNEQARALSGKGVVTSFRTSDRLRHYASFPYNTTLFYDEGRIDDLAYKEDEPAKAAAKDFYETAHCLQRELGLGGFPAYFAILVADGDQMGKLIRDFETPEEHRRLSAGLADFARRAEAIVADQFGALIYAGGDDVLAFLPLDTALACAEALRLAFEGMVGEAAGRHVTLSAGVGIVHAVEHLQHALEWARNAEQYAKQTRNSLAVAFHARSGGGHPLTVSHKWSKTLVPGRWQGWIDAFVLEAVAIGSLYELRELARELRRQDAAVVSAVLPFEVKRILRRKRQRDGTPTPDGMIKQLQEAFGPTVDSLEAAVDELLIARQIAAVVKVTRPASAPAGVEARA